jgi:carboxypeptidase Taq
LKNEDLTLQHYEQLKARLVEIGHIGKAAAVLGWDQQCYMPPGGARERAEQLAVLGKITHERFVADETRRLLEGAEAEVADRDPESDEAALARVVRRDFDKSVKIPAELVAEMAKTTALAHEVWVKAREDSDYKAFAPSLEKILDLNRQVAEHLGYEDQMYDALLDQYEPGMKTRDVGRVFAELKPGLVRLVRDIAARPPIDDSVLRRPYDEAKQLAFGEYVIRKMGFDFTRGRQDRAVHPFCTAFGKDDVRITTRFDKNWLPSALMGTIHEAGHALYEQGFDPKDDDTPLADAASLGVHESQSRLWENLIGRSRGFWDVFFPDLRRQFPEALADVDVETFYRAINKVEPSLIRVEADEVTYNLHIMLRFEMELALLDGSLPVADAPEAWNAKMREYLGITPPSDAEGVLQDVHWSGGSFGYFPTYSLGTLLSAQLYDKAVADAPSIPDDLARGEFGSLLAWLRAHVHKPGRRHLPAELIERACGEPAQSRSYLNYLNAKFRALYALE